MKYVIATVVMVGFLHAGNVQASHEIVQPPKPEASLDDHLSWHQFRHELSNYPQVQANITHAGIITISGHVDSGIEKLQVENFARKVRGATKIMNLIVSD